MQDTSLAKKLFDRIFHTKKALQKTDGSKAEIKRLQETEKLWLKSAKQIGNMQFIKYLQRLDDELEKELQDVVENNAETSYNRKGLINNTFPPYNESFSDANERATRWAKQDHIKDGAQKLISYHDRWYLIEKFSDMELGYLIVDFVKKKDYDLIKQQIEQQEEGLNYEREIDESLIDYENGGREQGANSNETSNGRTNIPVSTVVERESARKSSENNGRRDSLQSSGNKQNVKFNLKLGNETVTGEAETTKNLVALHNLTEDKLLSVIRLGGFPMPSIAITKADIKHSSFGNITVVFGKDTIDPQKNSANKVYDKDAWTPTFPRIDALLTGVEEEAQKDISRVKEYEDYRRDIDNFYGQLQGYTGENILENNDTEKFKRYAKTHYNGVLATYLKEKGMLDIAPVTKEKRYTRQNISASALKSFIDANGYTLEELMNDRNLSTDEFLSKYKAPVKEFLVSVLEKENVPRSEAEERFENIGFGEVDDVFYNSIKLLKSNKITENDEKATREKLLSQIDENEFDKWIDEKFLSLTETVGIRNDKEVYTPSGTRRKFNALHTEYTLQNIVRAMKSEADQTGQAGWFGAGVGSISAKLARKFRSIKDIKDASAFLKTDEDAYTNAQKKASDLLSEVVQDLTKGKNSMYASNTARDIISEIADKNPQTKEEIFTYLSRESEWVTVTEDVAEKILVLFDALRHMPTDYFEAKPQRAVGLDEIKMVLIPQSASQKLRNYLKNSNIPFQEYDQAEGRTEAIKKFDNVRFNRKPYTEKEYNAELKQLIESRGDYIFDSREKLLEVVDFAFNNPTHKATAYFGIIDAEKLSKIENSIPNLPKDIDGTLFKVGLDYSITTTLDSIRHIVDDKGLSQKDVIDYLSRFVETITDFDSVAFDYYYQGKSKQKGLLFKKQFEDGEILSFSVVSNKKRCIALQSLYLNKEDYQKKKSAETLLMQNAPAHTPKVQVGQTSTNSISQSNKNVNSKFNLKVYTEKEYNDFGWARANDILNAGQNEDYRSKFAKALNGDKSFRKTKSGELMIPVSDIYDKTFEGVNNTIVYAKGTIDKPIITRVLEIDEYDETILSEIRRDLYETERRGVQQKTGGIFRRYTKTDFGDYGDVTGNLSKRQGYNNGLETDGRTSGGEANGTEKQSNVKFNLKKITDPIVGLSMGEITKYIANYTRQTVHSKKETEIKINNIINDLGKLFTDEKISLKGKSREYVIQMVLKIF